MAAHLGRRPRRPGVRTRAVAARQFATYRVCVDSSTREDITAATAVHRELGPSYEDAVAESLVDRIGAEVDKRVDTRLAQRGEPPASPEARPARPPWPPVVLALGSMGVGLLATLGVVANSSKPNEAFGLSLVIWVAIAIVNIAYSRRR
jgi:hypothetical protein